MELELKGWKAVAAGAVVLGLLGFRAASQTEAMSTQGVEALERHLMLEAARGTLPEIEAALADPATTEAEIRALADEFAEERFEVLDVTRSGLGDSPVAKVEIRDAGSGATRVRYFRMEYGTATGWRVVREADALAFWLNVI